MCNAIAKSYIDIISSNCKDKIPCVAIHCIVYNQELYVRDTLEGFINQKTDFPFVVIIHDDASTDNTVNIIEEFVKKYPDIIFPIYEKENQYSQKKGNISRIMREAILKTGAKYIAICEGDDYWIDPLKLQKQVDFLENNPEYTLCSTNILKEDREGNKIPSEYNVSKTTDPEIGDIIMGGGLYLSTPTLIFRKSIYENISDEIFNLYVGDYPLQIFMAYKGKIRILNDVTAVYRFNSIGSWNYRHHDKRFNYTIQKEMITNEFNLLNTMDRLTGFEYSIFFKNKKNLFGFNHLLPFSPIDIFPFLKNGFKIIRHYHTRSLILFSLMPKFIKRKHYKY